MSDAKPYTMEDVTFWEREAGEVSCVVRANLVATVRALDAAQAENAALRARVAELESVHAEQMGTSREHLHRAHERCDEWKARATESAASAERMREALMLTREHMALWAESSDGEDEAVQADLATVDAALSEPIAPWLAERDRALAMRVAEVVLSQAAEAACAAVRHSQQTTDQCRTDVRNAVMLVRAHAIVDAALKVKP